MSLLARTSNPSFLALPFVSIATYLPVCCSAIKKLATIKLLIQNSTAEVIFAEIPRQTFLCTAIELLLTS